MASPTAAHISHEIGVRVERTAVIVHAADAAVSRLPMAHPGEGRWTSSPRRCKAPANSVTCAPKPPTGMECIDSQDNRGHSDSHRRLPFTLCTPDLLRSGNTPGPREGLKPLVRYRPRDLSGC